MSELKRKYTELFGEDSTDEDEVVKEINNFLHLTIPPGPAVPRQRSTGRGHWQALTVQRNPEFKQQGSPTSDISMVTNPDNTEQQQPVDDISNLTERMSISSGLSDESLIAMCPDETPSEKISPSSPLMGERIDSPDGIETDEETVPPLIQVDKLFPKVDNSVHDWEAAYEEMDQALQQAMKAHIHGSTSESPT